MSRRIVLGASVLVAALVPGFASCADTESGDGPSQDASVTLVEASSSAPDAGPDVVTVLDSGCDASEPSCVSHVRSCAETAWCPVPTTVSPLFALTSVWGSGPSDVWAVGSGGTIVHWDGSAWKLTPTAPATQNTLRGVWGSGPNDIWAVSRTDVIFHSTGFANGTATWTPAPGPGAALPEQRAATAIWGTSATDVRIAFLPRFLFDPTPAMYNQWVKGNDDWSVSRGDGAIFAFWGTANDVWYVADNSETNGWQRAMTVHGTPNTKGEMEWALVESQSTSTLEGIWGSGPNDLWAVGDNGTIRHLGASKTLWDVIASPTTDALHAVWGTASNNVWAVGDNGTILHFDGQSWMKSSAAFEIGKKPRLAAIWGSGPNDVWIVGEAVALHYTGPKPGVKDGEP